MMKRSKILLGLFTLFLVSCVTVNLYFPSGAIQKAADQIVDEEQGKVKVQEKKSDQKPQSSIMQNTVFTVSFSPSEAYAAEGDVDINVSTPAIRTLRDSLRDRFQLLKPYLDKGAVGQNSGGYLEIRDASPLTLKEKAELNMLVDKQNKDRRTLYEEIVRANKLGSDSIPKVEKIFAKSRSEKAQPGWWIQQENGQWVKK
ncbi:MAG TPA: YdbL family protein [Dissulfurispiraceae bacterium]|nr:YdbL family protein [Dissulfurispiraceae bacterium]